MDAELTGQVVSWDHAHYNADREYVRSTNMKHFVSAQGPRAYYWEVLNPPRRQTLRLSDEKVGVMQLGNIVHEYLLEEKQNWKVMPSRRNSNAAKDLADEFPDKWLITEAQEADILGMREGALRNPKVRRLVEDSHSEREQTILFDWRGVKAKVRLDMLVLGNELEGIYDIKTTLATSRDKFNYQIRQLKYDFSAAMYLYGVQQVKQFATWVPTFNHIAISKKRPYYTYVWPLDMETFIKVGLQELGKSFEVLRICMEACAEKGLDPASPEAIEFWPDRTEQFQENPNTAPPWYVASSNSFDPDSPMSEREEGSY